MRIAAVCCAALLVSGAAHGQDDPPAHWTASARAKVAPGGLVTVDVEAGILAGWHVYSATTPPGGPTRTSFRLIHGEPFHLDGAIKQSAPTKLLDPNFGIQTEFFTGAAMFQIPMRAAPGAETGRYEVELQVTYQACTDRTCLPPADLAMPLVIEVRDAPKTGEAVPKGVAATPLTDTPVAIVAASVAPQPAPILPPSTPIGGLGAFLWLSATMGALSLLTPCVFPMVPITVSYFSNHGSGTRRGAVSQAAVYGVGIVLTFSALGLALAAVFGAGGVNQLAANPWVNLLITGVFVAFAFSLFGVFLIQAPTGLLNRLDGIARGHESGRVVGALLMGLTFTLTSFTCTAPFVGTLLVMAAQGSWRWPLAGMLCYSSVFALPFFILALAPQLVSQMPRAGGWMNSVKVVMGFLEIAAAMKFLSNADLVWGWHIFTHDVVLSVWIAAGFLTTAYLMGFFRMEHDSPVDRVGGLRVMAALAFLAVTIALVPGLFGGRLGELDSFLPPPASETGSSGTRASGDLPWILNDLDAAREQARREHKLLFVDFTGYTCTNCRWMEANMFPRPEVRRELEAYVTVRLYTDGKGEIFQRQQKLQQSMFHTVALPLYVILRDDGASVATFPGLTRDASEFLHFLRGGTSGGSKS
jgi:thiol:disulfide interchange protein DsbD